MKIEKKKVIGSSNISSIAQSAFAVALGITTVSMTACEDPSSALRNDNEPDINSSNDTAVSSSSEAQAQSSSSKVIDIPKSYEHYSSSAIEALSSASQPVSRPISSSIISSGIPHVYSSPSSSSANDEIIKNNPEIDSTLIPTDFPAIKDSLIRIHLCEDPNSPGCLIESMVTTLETNDIA
ncbi:MAG: hypothetical protein J6W51_05600 [Fibrobacter sp.]|nr:hypothetical protein [Fibrobacter sp.]